MSRVTGAVGRASVRTTLLALVLATLVAVGVTGPSAEAKPKPKKPVVTAVAPRTGSAAGGTRVTVTGKNFKRVKKVLFGTTAGTKVKVVSATKLTVVSPKHAIGKVDIVVRTAAGKSATSKKDAFTYTGPKVSKVAPTSGSALGGTLVTVTGTGFTGATKVSFGTASGTTLKVLSATRLTVVSPAHALGSVDVKVTTRAGTSAATAADRFRYAQLPTSVRAPLPPGARSDPAVAFTTVSCGGAGACMAVGSYKTSTDQLQGLIERLVGTTWTATKAPLPAGANTNDPGVRLTDVSCPDATFCLATGSYVDDQNDLQPLVLKWSGGAWAATSPALPAAGLVAGQTPLVAVSCSSHTFCVAVGDYREADDTHFGLIMTMSGSESAPFVATKAAQPADIQHPALLAVDCPADGSCAAVGTLYDASGNNQRGWMTTLATGSSTWSPVLAPLPADSADPPSQQLVTVSCATPGSCVAGGSNLEAGGNDHAQLSRYISGSWTSYRAPVPAGSAVSPGGQVNDISCTTTAGACAATDLQVLGDDGFYYGALVTSTADGIGAVRAPLAGAAENPVSFMYGVSCFAVTQCAAVGDFRDTAGNVRPILDSQAADGTWSGQRAPLPASANLATDAHLRDVSADTATTSVAVGHFKDTAGHTQGLLTILIPN